MMNRPVSEFQEVTIEQLKAETLALMQKIRDMNVMITDERLREVPKKWTKH